MTRVALVPLALVGAVLGGSCNSPPAPATLPAVVAAPAAPSGSAETPTRSRPALPVRARIQLAFGRTLSCARLDSSVHCWRGESTRAPLASIEKMTKLPDVIDVAVGWSHACAVTKSGSVFCWGENTRGQLGAGLEAGVHDEPVAALGVKRALAIAAGSWHSCALLADGAVSCWGENREGQTGSDVAHTRAANDLVLPARVAGVEARTSLVASRDMTCALGQRSTSCWGRFVLDDQMRAGGSQSSRARVVPSLDGALSIAARDETLCGLFEGGAVACWGAGAFSLMSERPLRAAKPLAVPVDSALAVAVGGYHACAILAGDRSVSCWGVNLHGELGRGSPDQDFAARAPERVPGLSRVSSLALGAVTSCAITEKDELWCWGRLPFTADGQARVASKPERIAVR